MSSVLLIYFRQGDVSWQEFFLEEGESIVGRGEECKLKFDDKVISRNHMKLLKSGDDVWVMDMNSKNGTRLDGVKIQPSRQVPVRVGQEIQIGHVVLKIQISEQLSQEILQPTNPHLERFDPDTDPMLSFSEFVLKYSKGDGEWKEIPLSLGDNIVGRLFGSELLLDDQMVSRRHARITVAKDTVIIVDLGSTNGTQVNGRPLPPREPFVLHEDHLVTIGSYLVQIEKNKKG